MKVSTILQFTIKGPYITLSQFLKEESFIASGGQAKWYLRAHPVLLNGHSEQHRGKKLHSGDQVVVAGKQYEFLQ